MNRKMSFNAMINQIGEQNSNLTTLQRQTTAFDVLLDHSSGKTKWKKVKLGLVITLVILFLGGIVGLLIKLFVLDEIHVGLLQKRNIFKEVYGKNESILLIGGKFLENDQFSNSIEVLSTAGCKKLPR